MSLYQNYFRTMVAWLKIMNIQGMQRVCSYHLFHLPRQPFYQLSLSMSVRLMFRATKLILKYFQAWVQVSPTKPCRVKAVKEALVQPRVHARTSTLEAARTPPHWNMHWAILYNHHKWHSICKGVNWEADNELNRPYQCHRCFSRHRFRPIPSLSD